MNYDLQKLNSKDFERLIQALSRVVLGPGTISFGSGPDGGREATFLGKAEFPSKHENWEGQWVIQAKFKETLSSSPAKDLTWLENQLTNEFDKYNSRSSKVEIPNNYILFTNIKLSGVANTGGRDKITQLILECKKKCPVENISIFAYDDIVDFLNTNRDIAITFAPFILPGDILSKLLDLLKINEDRNTRINEIISRFLEIEFKEDIQSKLDHAGKLTNDQLNLEKVFIDLDTSNDKVSDSKSSKFINATINLGNILPKSNQQQHRFVLIAGPGYGKSTLVQFLSQIYRAFFLKDLDRCENTAKEVDFFINDYSNLIKIQPKWVRLPIKIILKDYANWIKENKPKNSGTNVSVINYIRNTITQKTGCSDFNEEDIERLIKNLPCLFIFDGLDEVPTSSNRVDVLNEINLFIEVILRRLGSNAIIVATTRPQGYSQEFGPLKFDHLFIADMKKEDCMMYLNRLLEYIIDNTTSRAEKYKILLKVLNDPEMSRLMKSPLQASIMAILVKVGGEPPSNKFDLFSEYFNIIFNREKQRNISKILIQNPKYVKDIHYHLGLHLQAVSEKKTNPSATIPLSEFKKIIENYLRSKGLEKDEIKILSEQILSASTDRLVFISQLEDEKIGFAIRSLQEYFAAIGYIRGAKDPELRLKKISKNAYWNNTLLFVVGYISDNSTNLIPYIESLCAELNGSANDLNSKSISSLSQVGSWLSLDIIVEGIFRGNRNIENKFCHLLWPLFSIPFIDRHKDLLRLPDRIINTWIVKYLEEALSKDCYNFTAWQMIILLHKNKYEVETLVQKFFPVNQPRSLMILKLFIRAKIYDNFILKNFCFFLEKEFGGYTADIDHLIPAERDQ